MSADRETLDVYEAQAGDYAARFGEEKKRPDLDALIGDLTKGADVLDLGAGPGNGAAYLAGAGLNVIALEPTEAFARMIEAKGIPVRRETFSDLTDIAAFDAIVANFSLLHAPRAAMPDHLAAIRRALKPGGIFLIGLKTGTGEERDAIGRFYTYYSIPELTGLLETAGFTIDTLREGTSEGLAGTEAPFVVMRAHA